MKLLHNKTYTRTLNVALTTLLCLWALGSEARSVYVNGTDISQARNQNLKNVNLKIDENGNIFIDAPHYQIHEESSYTPLSQYLQGLGTPAHNGAQKIPPELGSISGAETLPPVDPELTGPGKVNGVAGGREEPQQGKPAANEQPAAAAASDGAGMNKPETETATAPPADKNGLQQKAGSKG